MELDSRNLENFGQYSTSDESSDEDSFEDEQIDAKDDERSDYVGDGVMSMEELIKQRDKIGLKKLEKKMKIKSSNSYTIEARKTKHKPQEISSKKRFFKNKKAISLPAQSKSRDPRFDALCGSEFNQEVFDKRYGFLDAIKQREKKKLQKQLRFAKTAEKKEKLTYLLGRLQQQQKAKEQRMEKKKLEKEWKQEEKKKVAQGKKPYFLKESEKEKLFSSNLKATDKKSKSRREKLKAEKELKQISRRIH